jgi:ligand-binding sensor domain-containing protein
MAQYSGVGRWSDHYSYRDVKAILMVKDEVCGVTENGLLYYNKAENSVRRKTTVQGLSGVGLSASAYEPVTQTQIVGYQNGNIDLLQHGRVLNIPDLQRKEISGSKRINQIVIENSQKVYLCCDFGIVVLNLSKQEISETYFIGANSSNVQVNDLAVGDTMIYAATNNGLLSAYRFSNRLNDFSEWREVAIHSRVGLPVQNVCLWNENLIVRQSNSDNKDTVWRYENEQWQVLDTVFTRQIKVSHNRLLQLRKIPDRDYLFEICEYGADFKPLRNYGNNAGDVELWTLNDIVSDAENRLWYSTGYGGIDQLTANWTFGGEILPQGPASNSVYSLSHSASTLYMTRGGVTTSAWTPVRNDFEVNTFQNGHWRTINNQSIGSSWLGDAVAVAEDPANPNVFAVASGSSGVVQANADGSVTIYNDVATIVRPGGSTTVLEDSTGFGWTYWNGNKESIRMGDVKFDKQNQLWVTQSFVDKQLHKRTPDGKWTSFALNNIIGGEPREFIIDYHGQLWIRTQWDGLLFFHETATGFEAKRANLNLGNNQAVSALNCLVEDKKGYVWLGTNHGILVNRTSLQLFDNPNGAESSVLFEAIGIDGSRPLMENENVMALAVEGADRKWIGTSSSGVFLMSADGMEMIHQFNTENSPLNSNAITALAINPKTGEVYIGTDKGLMSFGGDATQAGTTKAEQNIVIFPNPVSAGFAGEIGIRGLVDNAKVHITDAGGALVFETTAKGGMATWNGRTRNGQRVKAGVYIVFSTDANGGVTAVRKIFVEK